MSAGQGFANAEMRDHNRGLILSVLDENGPLARTDLAQATGLVHGAISALVAGLIDDGLVRATEAQARTGQRGRPREQLEIDGRGVAVVAVQVLYREYRTLVTDLGGREVHRDGTLLDSFAMPDADALTSQIAAEIDRAAEAAAAGGMRVGAVRMALPGGVSAQGRSFEGSIDLGWLGEEAGQPLFVDRVLAKSEHLRMPPRGVNDANAAAFAEFALLRRQPRFGELRDLVYLKGDVGFGGGAIVRGELVDGQRGYGFEPGHIRIDGVHEICECGQLGCLAIVASSQAVLENAGLSAFAERSGWSAAFEELDRRLLAGDGRAADALERALDGVRQVLATSIMLFGPQLVVLGGYLRRYRDRLRTISEVPLAALGAGGLAGAEAILASEHGELAALRGAIDGARRELLRDPSLLAGAARLAG